MTTSPTGVRSRTPVAPLNPALVGADRYAGVTRVLWGILVLNLVVAVTKIALGFVTGAVSILSDGFHSLTDSASNVVAIVGVRIASRPPDENHPYGHRKYETMASLAILIFLVIVLVEVVTAALGRLHDGSAPTILPGGIAVMVATLVVNIGVVVYESRAGRRLNSEVLLADANHTRSDVFTSIAVIGALLGVRAGYPMLDPLAALLVAGFIGRACWQIAKEASRILSDEIVFAESDLREEVLAVPGVLGCHRIRTRGSADHVFLDMHVWFDGSSTLHAAHDASHVVKDRLMGRYPQIVDVVIHLEPPPRDGDSHDA